MALKARLATLDNLDDETRALYRPEGDGFVLDVDPVEGFELAQADKLKAELDANRQARKLAERKLSALDGIDVEAARAAIEKTAGWSEEAEIDKLRRAAEARVVAEKDLAIEAARASVESVRLQLIEAAARVEIESALKRTGVFMPAAFPLVVKDLRQSLSVTLDDKGKASVALLDRHGNPRLVEGEGRKLRRMTADDLVREVARHPDYKPLLKAAPASPGSGSAGWR